MALAQCGFTPRACRASERARFRTHADARATADAEVGSNQRARRRISRRRRRGDRRRDQLEQLQRDAAARARVGARAERAPQRGQRRAARGAVGLRRHAAKMAVIERPRDRAEARAVSSVNIRRSPEPGRADGDDDRHMDEHSDQRGDRERSMRDVPVAEDALRRVEHAKCCASEISRLASARRDRWSWRRAPFPRADSRGACRSARVMRHRVMSSDTRC